MSRRKCRELQTISAQTSRPSWRSYSNASVLGYSHERNTNCGVDFVILRVIALGIAVLPGLAGCIVDVGLPLWWIASRHRVDVSILISCEPRLKPAVTWPRRLYQCVRI